MFFSGASRFKEKVGLRQVTEQAAKNHAMVRAKFKEVDEADAQFMKLISETKHLTASVSEKLDMHLKITRSTVKSICQSLRDGVVLIDFSGKIIDLNGSCEKIFTIQKDSILGDTFNHLMRALHLKLNGVQFNFSTEFFKELSEKIFGHQQLESPDGIDLGQEISLSAQPAGCDKFNVVFSFSVLDNEPSKVEDVTYMVYFKAQPSLMHA